MDKQQERLLRQQIVENLLIPMWRGLSGEYKSNYRSNVWEQFANNIRSATRTDTLAEWYTKVCKKLPITIRVTDAAMVEGILNGENEEMILAQLREKTDLLVVMLQAINEERKEQWKRDNEPTQKGHGNDPDTTPHF